MKSHFKKLIAALAFAGVGFASQACVIRETGVNRGYGYGYAQAGYHGGGGVYVGDPNPYYTSSMPPEPLYESMSTSPGYGYVWIDGYWNWNGYEWVWVSGSWNRDQSGYVYVQPYYDYSNDYGYVYYPGHWSRPDRVPDRVKVVDHRDGRPRTGYQPPRTHTSGGDRDHRDNGGDYTPPPRDRDHRDTDTDSGTSRNPPRDHRGDDSGTSKNPPRDHRDPKTTGTPPRDRMPANDKSPGTRTPPKKSGDKQPTRVRPTEKVRDKAPTRTRPSEPTRAPNTGTKVRDKPSKPAPRGGRDHRRTSMIEASENPMTSGRAVAMTSGRETGLKTARGMSMTSARRR